MLFAALLLILVAVVVLAIAAAVLAVAAAWLLTIARLLPPVLPRCFRGASASVYICTVSK